MTTPDVTELVDQTLDWVTYGEPNSTDLIAVTTQAFPVAAQDLGFRGTDDLLISRTGFIHDNESGCTVEIATAIAGTDTIPRDLTLVLGEGKHTSPSHREGLTAFYTWCATGRL